MLKNVPQRIYSQYRDKPKFVDWLAIARKQGGEIDAAAQAVLNSYCIETAKGEQLDVLGRIVVFDRSFIGHITMDVSEFDDPDMQCGNPDADFGESSVAADTEMSNELFRLAIKSKIMKNNGDATLESITEQMMFMFGTDYLRINNPKDMTFSIEFAGNLSPIQRWALFNVDLVQVPIGVEFLGFTELTDVVYFDDDEKEFGDDEAMFSDFTGG